MQLPTAAHWGCRGAAPLRWWFSTNCEQSTETTQRLGSYVSVVVTSFSSAVSSDTRVIWQQSAVNPKPAPLASTRRLVILLPDLRNGWGPERKMSSS